MEQQHPCVILLCLKILFCYFYEGGFFHCKTAIPMLYVLQCFVCYLVKCFERRGGVTAAKALKLNGALHHCLPLCWPSFICARNERDQNHSSDQKRRASSHIIMCIYHHCHIAVSPITISGLSVFTVKATWLQKICV